MDTMFYDRFAYDQLYLTRYYNLYLETNDIMKNFQIEIDKIIAIQVKKKLF